MPEERVLLASVTACTGCFVRQHNAPESLPKYQISVSLSLSLSATSVEGLVVLDCRGGMWGLL